MQSFSPQKCGDGAVYARATLPVPSMTISEGNLTPVESLGIRELHVQLWGVRRADVGPCRFEARAEDGLLSTERTYYALSQGAGFVLESPMKVWHSAQAQSSRALSSGPHRQALLRHIQALNLSPNAEVDLHVAYVTVTFDALEKAQLRAPGLGASTTRDGVFTLVHLHRSSTSATHGA